MKNLKIAAKIMVGFGAVIAMMLVMTVTVLVTNLGVAENISALGLDSTLQTKSFTLEVDFLNARVPANMMVLSTAAGNYESFIELEGKIDASLAEVHSYMDANPSLAHFNSEIDATGKVIGEWRALVHEKGDINAELTAAIENIVAVGAETAAMSSSLIDDNIAILESEINNDASASDLAFRRQRIRDGSEVNSLIYEFRLDGTRLMNTLQPEYADAALAGIDHAYGTVTSYANGSRAQSQKDMANRLADGISQYRAAIESFKTLCVRAAEIGSQMPELNAEAQDAIGTALANMDKTMSGQIVGTQNSSQFALVLVSAISLAAVVVAVFFGIYISRLISKPLKDMAGYIKQAGETGNLEFSEEDWANCDRLSKTKDETGQTMKAFAQMMRQFVYYGKMVQLVADRDLTAETETLGDSDTFGNAIADMVEKLNGMFNEINEATSQVSSGANQIADGASALASGSTEQAASVEELSSSISEIDEKTVENAKMAEKAAALSNEIKSNAQKGSEQMNQMMNAVSEISAASQSIGKVIKAIEDIAFQTNILALNAAVEAARAGEAGKGFAVVADEVRNLASKSSDAAKDTSSLIANSIEKAELGAKIATETAASLEEIVSGINESTEIVTDIAHTSEDQAASIRQINTGIDQVAQVVQQNSATAEESAAAAEELSSQATLLHDLVTQFKLKNNA